MKPVPADVGRPGVRFKTALRDATAETADVRNSGSETPTKHSAVLCASFSAYSPAHFS